MSLEFSRRSFLKYTAVAAVAVAGASLFTGCDTSDPYNLVCTGAGAMTVLQVTAEMGTKKDNKYTYELKAQSKADKADKVEFPFAVTNGRTNPLYINANNFKVTVTSKDGKTFKKYQAEVDPALFDNALQKNATSTGKVSFTPASALAEGDTVVLTYCPDLQYNEYSLNWKVTVAKADPGDQGSSNT